MSHIINTYNLFLSSEHRTSGTSANYSVALHKPLSLTNANNWFSVRVGSAEIPFTFPLINSTNNTLPFTLTRGGVPVVSSLVIGEGTYNINTLNDELSQRLAEKIFLLFSVSVPLSFSYERSSGRATYSMVGTDSIATSVTFHYTPVLFKCFGFSADFTFSYATPTVRTDATSTQNVNVTQNNALYIRSESFTQTSNFENIIQSESISDVLAKIQLTTTPQSYIFWTNSIDLEVEVSNRVIDIVNLYLGSSTAYEISLGNLEWACRITIKEHSDLPYDQQNQDKASQQLQNIAPLLEERAKIVEKLNGLKNKLVPLQNERQETKRKEEAST